MKRKVKELFLAPRLEQNLSKDEILYLYLNQIYLGHRRYGVEEASRFYFGKGVKDLTARRGGDAGRRRSSRRCGSRR